MIHWAKKVELHRDDGPLETFDDAKQAIPGNTAVAEADLRAGKEKLNYWMYFLGGTKNLNGWRSTRTDKKITIRSLTTETPSGEKITYKIGERKEINGNHYNYDKEIYSIMLIHGVNGKAINIVDGIEPLLLFTDDTRSEIHKSLNITASSAITATNCCHFILIIMSAFISITYNYFLK